MLHRLFGSCSLAAPIMVCVFLPDAALAQEPVPIAPPIPAAQPKPIAPPIPDTQPAPIDPATGQPLIRRPDWEAATTGPVMNSRGRHGRHGDWDVGVTAGPGKAQWHSGWPYGPTIAPPWGYPFLGGGPFVGYPWGWPGYSARAGQNWSNGLSLYGPPVPVYGPVPGIFGNGDLVRQWHDVPSMGIGYGWFGVYAASPRPRPLTVSVWPTIESVQPAADQPVANPLAPGGVMIVSVKVPQPNAEIIVDGVKTSQTGTDRLFESPQLEMGKQFRYEITARWMEGGVVREKKMAAVGTAGEVVRVDFTMP